MWPCLTVGIDRDPGHVALRQLTGAEQCRQTLSRGQELGRAPECATAFPTMVDATDADLPTRRTAGLTGAELGPRRHLRPNSTRMLLVKAAPRRFHATLSGGQPC